MVVKLTDVPDALGADLARLIGRSRAQTDAKVAGPLVGVVLDLRGNGGGSIDGATGALGLFLPGAPLFPLKHRDGAIETERATEPPAEERWDGAVAAIVDAATASAAEMIAGALRAYRRGVVLGQTTYGKGCAQEYFDDAAGAGTVRLSTLLFALPDGSAVQRVGVRPDVVLPLFFKSDGAAWGKDGEGDVGSATSEREADLARALPPWTGPDVRDNRRLGGAAWPSAKAIGPCSDELVCKALRALAGRGRDVAKR